MARSYGHLAMHATRAQRVCELGMISQVVDPPEKLFDEAQALAEKIAKNSPSAMIASKRALWGALEAGLTAAMKASGKQLMDMWDHPDQLEGPRAFAEKREPQLGRAQDRALTSIWKELLFTGRSKHA